jgi:hypothetical protein
MNEPAKQAAPKIAGTQRVSSVAPRPATRSPASTAPKVVPAQSVAPAGKGEERALDVTAEVVALEAAAPPPVSGTLKVTRVATGSLPPLALSSSPPRPTRTSTPPPLPVRAVAFPSTPPTPAPRIVSVVPVDLFVEEARELRALIGTANRALAALSTTIQEMERRVGELERNTCGVERTPPGPAEAPNTLPAPPPEFAGDSPSPALPPPAPVPTGLVPRPAATPASDSPWDGEKRRRNVALALTASALVGLAGLIAAMACSYTIH